MPRNIRTSPPPLQRAGLRWLSHSTAPHCTPHSSTSTTPNLVSGPPSAIKPQLKDGGAKWGKATPARRVVSRSPTTGTKDAIEAGDAVRAPPRGAGWGPVGRSGGTAGGVAEAAGRGGGTLGLRWGVVEERREAGPDRSRWKAGGRAVGAQRRGAAAARLRRGPPPRPAPGEDCV